MGSHCPVPVFFLFHLGDSPWRENVYVVGGELFHRDWFYVEDAHSEADELVIRSTGRRPALLLGTGSGCGWRRRSVRPATAGCGKASTMTPSSASGSYYWGAFILVGG